MTSSASKLLVNSAAGGGRFLISLLVVVILTPYLIEHVGTDHFGLWNLVLSTLGFFELLDFGFSNAIVKYVALYRGMGTIIKRNQALSTITCVLLCSAFIGLILIGIFSLVFNQLFKIPQEQQNTAIALVWLVGLRAIILGIPLGIYRGILFGEQKIFIIHVISSAYQIFYAILAFLFLRTGYGIVTIAWLTLITFLFESLTYAWYSYRFWPDIKLSWKLVDKKEFKEITNFSAAQFLATFTSLIVLRADPLIVGFFFSLTMVGVYAIALKIFTYAFILIKQFLQVLTPYISMSQGAGDTQKIRQIFTDFPKYVMFPTSLMTAAGICFAYPLITLWVGDEFAPAAPVLMILLSAFFLNVPEVVASDILAMTGFHTLMAKYNITGALVNIFLSVLLAIPMGINGIATGTFIGTIVSLFMGIRKVCQLYHVSYWESFVTMYIPGIVAGGVQWLISYWIKSCIEINRIWILFAAATPGILANAVIYWWFLDSKERAWIINKVRGKKR